MAYEGWAKPPRDMDDHELAVGVAYSNERQDSTKDETEQNKWDGSTSERADVWGTLPVSRCRIGGE